MRSVFGNILSVVAAADPGERADDIVERPQCTPGNEINESCVENAKRRQHRERQNDIAPHLCNLVVRIGLQLDRSIPVEGRRQLDAR